MSGRSEPVLSPIADSELASVDGNRVAVATAVVRHGRPNVGRCSNRLGVRTG